VPARQAIPNKRRGKVSEVRELTYCERCASSLDDEGFDYRFEYPICFKCVYKYHLEPIEEESK
jgi:recombinational DNA repair protein (RecF pathway)